VASWVRVMCGIGVVSVLALCGAAQGLETIRDTGYQPNPFNPGDSGRVQRIRLRDHDIDDHPVILTRVRVENLGTAGNQEIDWVRIKLNVGGTRTVLAEGDGFPLMTHLTGPVEDRKIPDDGLGFLEVSIGTSTDMVDGNTVRTEVSFWYSEGDYGGSATVAAEHAAVFNTEGFDAELLPKTTEGVVNPGDVFTALRFKVSDDVDNNFHSIYLTDFTVDGPGEPEIAKWILVIGPGSLGSPTVEIPEPGAAELPPEGLLTAPARSTREVELRGVVGSEPPEEITVQPSVSVTLREGPNTRTFNFTAPAAATVMNAGFEVLENRMIVRAGQILEREFQEIEHSTVYARDEDVNRTPVTIHSVGVANRGTADNVGFVEVWDERNRLLGVGEDWDDISVTQPDGSPLRVPDNQDIELRFVLGMGDDLPLGASLLLCKELHVEEVHPSLITDTRFEGRQQVCDARAVFFGEPEVWLRPLSVAATPDDPVEVTVGTDGETVDRVEGVLGFDHATCVEVINVEAARPYNLVDSAVHVDEQTGRGELSFVLELTGASPRAGDLLSVSFAYKEPEVEEQDGRPCDEALIMPSEEELERANEEDVYALLPVNLTLNDVTMRDTADIELPFSLVERELSLELPAPLPELEAVEISKTAAPTTVSEEGTQVEYTYIVRNTGHETLTGITVYDDHLDTYITLEQDELAPGEETQGTAYYVISRADIDRQEPIVNTATVTTDQDVEASDTATVNIDVPVVVEPPAEEYAVGDVITPQLDEQATVILVEPRVDAADRIVGMWQTEYDPDSDTHVVEIPTDALTPGRYELMANGELLKVIEMVD